MIRDLVAGIALALLLAAFLAAWILCTLHEVLPCLWFAGMA